MSINETDLNSKFIVKLGERDRRIEKLERDVTLIRGFLAHALRLAGDHEDANALDPAHDE